MAMQSGNNYFSPLMIGAVAVIAVLVLFLVFAGGPNTQQAGIDTVPPPAAKSVTPPAGTPKPSTTPGSGSQ